MWFKNLQIYRFTKPFELDAATLGQQLEQQAFTPCAGQEESREQNQGSRRKVSGTGQNAKKSRDEKQARGRRRHRQPACPAESAPQDGRARTKTQGGERLKSSPRGARPGAPG